MTAARYNQDNYGVEGDESYEKYILVRTNSLFSLALDTPVIYQCGLTHFALASLRDSNSRRTIGPALFFILVQKGKGGVILNIKETNDDWDKDVNSELQRYQAMVIPLLPEAIGEACLMTNVLKTVGIHVKLTDEKSDLNGTDIEQSEIKR